MLQIDTSSCLNHQFLRPATFCTMLSCASICTRNMFTTQQLPDVFATATYRNETGHLECTKSRNPGLQNAIKTHKHSTTQQHDQHAASTCQWISKPNISPNAVINRTNQKTARLPGEHNEPSIDQRHKNAWRTFQHSCEISTSGCQVTSHAAPCRAKRRLILQRARPMQSPRFLARANRKRLKPPLT